MKSTSVLDTIASNRLLAEQIDHPLHLGITEAGTKWSGSLKSAVGLGTLLADGIGDTIRISLSTFHAEEEVKVAWEILKALKLRERGPVLIACPDLRPPAVRHGLRRRGGRAAPGAVRRPDRGLDPRLRGQRHRRGAPRGLRHHRRQGLRDDLLQGEPLKKVATEHLVDELFAEIDQYYASGKTVVVDAGAAAEAARGWPRTRTRRDDARAPLPRWRPRRPKRMPMRSTRPSPR